MILSNPFENEYIRIVNNLLSQGVWQLNERTGKRCLMYHGDMMKFDLSTGKFPLLTTKKMYTTAMIGELIAFIRGTDNAASFRKLGCNFWDANANESKHWLDNPNRKGEDDLGRIYGVQARKWENVRVQYTPIGIHDVAVDTVTHEYIDQLKNVIDKLTNKIDDRRLIVTHWNPGELDQMALPPCHLLYQFGIRNGYLDLCMYQRSCDIPLGIPMNIASYCLLLSIVAKITGLVPGVFTHFMHNIHIYEDQIEGIKTQLSRDSFEAPSLQINENIKSLSDLETWVKPLDFTFINYQHHPAINFPFSA